MAGDNGKGLRALFYGLCSLHGIEIWDEERTGPMPADFYLPGLASRNGGEYVVIVPGAAGRQVEIAALLAKGEAFIVLDDWDLDEFRQCQNKVAAAEWLRFRARVGDTHAARERQRLGISS